MEESRKVYGWLVRDGNAAAGCSSMWTGTRGGENYCGNLLWQSGLTLLPPVITKRADFKDFAHEIGHAFGMDDIYKKSEDGSVPSFTLQQNDMAAYSRMQSDWNGGCRGHGSCGVRYYAPQTSMSSIISRLLMNGERSDADNPLDITNGDIFGVYYTSGPNQTKIWHKDAAMIAFPWVYRNPTHQ